jgi:hypothetical protein
LLQNIPSWSFFPDLVPPPSICHNNYAYRGFDFITLEIDGVTEVDFFCSFEGLYYYSFHLAEIMWGILWLYDYILTLKKPNLYTGKYLMYYCICAYFVSFGFSICSYFQNNNNFTSVII